MQLLPVRGLKSAKAWEMVPLKASTHLKGSSILTCLFGAYTCPQIRLSACLLEAYEARKEESRKLLIGLNC